MRHTGRLVAGVELASRCTRAPGKPHRDRRADFTAILWG
jgi:hypothetical protein